MTTTTYRPALPASALDQLFRAARTYPRFLDVPIDEATIRSLHDLLRWGPTAFNAQPARFLFLQSAGAREQLASCVSSSNQSKVRSAAVSVIVAHDLDFVQALPRFTASASAVSLFEQWPQIVEPTALRSGALQGAYLIVAARALGLDVGVLTGFDADKVAKAFFGERRWQANFVANLGVGDPASLTPRFPRYEFDEVATIL
ncbi:MAG: malonic semialdehyde reductase [Rhizobacter sp.]